METVEKRFLSIQSHVVSGYVGNKCAVFPLQLLGFEVDFINSVQFSNHTGYRKWKGQVLAENDLQELYDGLKMNNLAKYTNLLTGYVGSESFLRKITEVVSLIKKENPGTIYMCDPVLGDCGINIKGEFYVPKSLIPIYLNEVLPLADITTPNTFELELLADMKIKEEEDAIKGMNFLHGKGVPIVVLSSLDSDNPETMVTYVSQNNDKGKNIWKIEYPKLNGSFTGTGDLFAALFIGWYTKLEKNIPNSLQNTISTMEVVLRKTKEKADSLNKVAAIGTPIELQLVQSRDAILEPKNLRQVQSILVKQ